MLKSLRKRMILNKGRRSNLIDMKYLIYSFILFGFLLFICPVDSFAQDKIGESQDIYRLLTSAEAFMTLKDYNSALDVLDRVEKMDKSQARIYFLKGEVFRLKKDYDTAILEYNLAIKKRSDMCSAYVGRARALIAKSKYIDAMKDLNFVINNYPNYTDAYNERGLVYFKKGMYESAIADFNQAIKNSPNDNKAVINRAQTYIASGKLLEAENDLDFVISSYAGIPLGGDIGDEIAWAYFYKGKVHVMKSDDIEDQNIAKECFEKFLLCKKPENADSEYLYASKFVAGEITPETNVKAEIIGVKHIGDSAVMVEMKVENNTPHIIYSVEVPNFDLVLDGVNIGRRNAMFSAKDNSEIISPFTTGHLSFLIEDITLPFTSWNVSVFDFNVNFGSYTKLYKYNTTNFSH